MINIKKYWLSLIKKKSKNTEISLNEIRRFFYDFLTLETSCTEGAFKISMHADDKRNTYLFADSVYTIGPYEVIVSISLTLNGTKEYGLAIRFITKAGYTHYRPNLVVTDVSNNIKITSNRQIARAMFSLYETGFNIHLKDITCRYPNINKR